MKQLYSAITITDQKVFKSTAVTTEFCDEREHTKQ